MLTRFIRLQVFTFTGLTFCSLQDVTFIINIVVNDEKLEQVREFKYLGQNITEDGKTENDVKIRIDIAKTRFQEMSNILTSRHISTNLRLRLAKCYVYSTLTYGCETRTLSKDSENRINAFEMWVFRRIERIKWTDKITNEEVCRRLNVEKTLLTDIKTRKLNYFGHVKRHNTIKKDILEAKLEGKRAQGRQRRRWEDDVKSWTGLNFEECTRAAGRREDWRAISRLPRNS